MKKRFQKVITICLAIMVVISCFGVDLNAYAATNETPNYKSAVTSYEDLQNRLNGLVSKYTGTYWTTNGKAANSSGSTSKYYYGIQCKGFASYIFNDLFCSGFIGSTNSSKYYITTPNGATLINKASDINTSTAKSILSNGNIGDFIQVKRRSSGGPHSMILAGKDDNGIWIFDCNSDNQCGVKHYYQTYATFASKNIGMSLYHSTKYPPISCNCSTSYAGEYEVTTSSASLTIRSGHGTNFSSIGSIPKGTHVTVSKANGSWAHVSYNGVNGYCSMQYLKKVNITPSYLDVGTDFYAYIINTSCWKHLTNDYDNLSFRTETGEAKQVWKFERQNDGSYKIINCGNNKVMDVQDASSSSGTNVWAVDWNGSNAQKWYIYGTPGAYYFKPACSDCVLDMNSGTFSEGVNAQIWEKNDTVAQKFQIYHLSKPDATTVSVSAGNQYKPTRIWWDKTNNTTKYTVRIFKNKVWEGEEIGSKGNLTTNDVYSVNLPAGYYEAYVDSCNNYSYTMSKNVVKFTVKEGTPEKIDTGFYGYIINTNTGSYLINDKKGNVCFNKTNSIEESQKIWYFTRNANDSFTIKSVVDNGVLDVYDSVNENGTNVEIWSSNGGLNQQWYFQGESPYYYIKPAYTDRVLDLNGAKYYDNVNAQIWEKNDSDAQKFKIVRLEEPKISYNMNGGTGTIESQTKTYGKDLTLSSTKPTRTGYEFVGWNTNKDATTAQYQPGGKYTADIGATLYAVWKANTYTVAYNMNGGSGSISSQTKTYGQDLTLSSTKPTRTGYEFLGWNTSSSATTAQYQAGGKYTANSGTTLYAVWKANTYTITYHMNDGSGKTEIQIINYGQSCTISSKIPTRPGYEFLGWNTSSSATTAQYQPGGKYTTNNSVTLYAIWKATTYTVSYNMNGGNGSISKQTKTYGQDLILSSTIPTRAGYEFLGWNTNSSATTAQYQAGGKYTANSNVTLYAIWKSTSNSDDPNAAQIVVDSKTASAGNKVTVNVSLKNNPGIMGFKFNVSYDSSVMTLENAESVGIEALYSQNITDNPFVVSWESGVSEITTNGEIVKLTFAVKSDAKEGTYPITITYDEDEIYNLKEENVHFDIVNGAVNVTAHLPGDINNDGKVNMKDLTRLHQYINGWSVTVNESAIDVNGDGKVNMKDLTRLHQYINGWNVDIY